MKRTCSALLALALAGCTGSLFSTHLPPPSVYLLQSAVDRGAPPPIAAELAVLKPRVRTGLDSEHIAVLYADRRLDYFATAAWSGPLDRVVQDLAVESLRRRATLRGVEADTSPFAARYWLEIRVSDFQAEYAPAGSAPTVHVRLLARLGESGDRRVLADFEADVHRPVADDRLTAIVEAFNRAADEALARIADATGAVLARPPD